MSHLVTITTQIRDPITLQAACERLKLPAPTFGEARLYSATATGWRVQLPGWRYLVVCDVRSGELHFDHFEGRWGEPAHLDRLLQNYAVEKAKLEARKAGRMVVEEPLTDGSIKLTINAGGLQ